MRTPEDKRRTVGTALILLVIAVIFGAIFVFMYSVGLMVLPQWLANFFGLSNPGEDEATPWDTGELYSMLREGEPESDENLVSFELDYENIRLALLSEPEPLGSFREAKISYYSDGEASSHSVRLYTRGEEFRVERYEGTTSSRRTMLAVADADAVTVVDGSSGDRRTLARAEGISAEEEAGFPSVEGLLAKVAEFPSEEGGDSRYEDCELKMLEQDGTNVYFVAFTDTKFDLREEYFMSLEHRVIISQRTLADDELVYSFETVAFSVEQSRYGDERLYTTY